MFKSRDKQENTDAVIGHTATVLQALYTYICKPSRHTRGSRLCNSHNATKLTIRGTFWLFESPKCFLIPFHDGTERYTLSISQKKSYRNLDIQHFIEVADLQPGFSILDLGCGNGIAGLKATLAIGETGAKIVEVVWSGELPAAAKELWRQEAGRHISSN